MLEAFRDRFDHLPSGAHREIDRRGPAHLTDDKQPLDAGLVGVVEHRRPDDALRRHLHHRVMMMPLQPGQKHRVGDPAQDDNRETQPRRFPMATSRSAPVRFLASRIPHRMRTMRHPCGQHHPARRPGRLLQSGFGEIQDRQRTMLVKPMALAASDDARRSLSPRIATPSISAISRSRAALARADRACAAALFPDGHGR